jgi:hypothetical protein
MSCSDRDWTVAANTAQVAWATWLRRQRWKVRGFAERFGPVVCGQSEEEPGGDENREDGDA